MKNYKGIAIASAVASMFALNASAEEKAPAKPTAKTDTSVLCSGVNECKGKGICASSVSSCGGQNACKGKGVVKMSQADCSAKKGTVVIAKKM